MKKKILFRADGNATIGLGHIYRLFSIAEMAKDSYEFCFLTRTESVLSIMPLSYKHEIIPNNIDIGKEPHWISQKFCSDRHLIIADGYFFNSLYQKNIKNLGYSLIYIDDLAKGHMSADIIINHSPSVTDNFYSKESHTKLALGTKYALLRPTFINLAVNQREINTVDTAFVCFGGSDPQDFTSKVLQALLKVLEIKKINVVLGDSYKHTKLLKIVHSHKDRISLYRNLEEEDLTTIMLESNLGIVPSSTILYEVCCVKMAVLSGFFTANQELIYNGFLNANAIFGLGNLIDYNINDFINKITLIINSKDISEKVKAQQLLFDSKIKNRILNIINSLC